ncbi:uncharacterized protein IL334_003374 [Kwoniella shivajii]|uniref:Uncharacterized protein n=1 Tax=Kwoniella shivajii TaxID=564305 RepID=A0ABZ1CXX9_9TREE|nr:hypothetical protein IL334_003374 [Kwoniella shivajii]
MPPKAEKEFWNDDHTREVIRGIIKSTLSNRSEIYSYPALSGVSDNGGDRINKKIQQILKKLCDTYPGFQGMVEEEVKNMAKGKSTGNGTPSPKKNGSTPKKRKVKDEDDD